MRLSLGLTLEQEQQAMEIERPMLFSIRSYDYLREEMLAIPNPIQSDDPFQKSAFLNGSLEEKSFPDGERYHRVGTDVAGRDIYLIGGTVSDASTLDLYDIACALVKYGATRLTLVIPYFGYSTMERSIIAGEVVPAKTRARLLSAIPSAPHGNRVMLLDLHSLGIPHYFEGNISPIHLYAKSLIKNQAFALGHGKDFVLACTDAGRAKWVESLANDMGVSAAFVFKKRLSGDKTKITGISADVSKRIVIIYDDMIRTGGSLIDAAQAYLDAGAKEVHALTTHGLFCKDAFMRIIGAGVKTISCTDSHPEGKKLGAIFAADSKYGKLMSCAPIFAEEILRHPLKT